MLTLLLTMVLSVLFIMTGMYGELERIDVTLISMQLLIAGQIMFLLNGLVEKGYCLGTEISLFIVANICGTIMWKAFSPVTVYTEHGGEYEGVLLFLFQALSAKNDTIFFLRRAYFRQNLPNLVNLLATIFVFLIVIYLKGLCVKLPMRSTIHKERYRWGFFHINFLYTSVFPLIFQSTLVSTLNYFSQILSTKFSEHFFFTLLGVWADVGSDGPPRSYPIGGLCYYLSPPRTSLQVTQDPVYAVVYTVFMIGSCALYSRICINVFNINADNVATKLTNKKMVMRGHGKETMSIELDRNIFTAAVSGGLCLGALSVLADFLGVFGSGTGVIMVAIIMYDNAELFFTENNMKKESTLLY